MAIDTKYSLWLSTRPWDDSNPLTDADFMYIGNSSQYPQSISYNSSITGILGQSPDTAIFVDGVGGAVMRINLSAIRPQPKVIDDTQPNYFSNKAFIEKMLTMRSAIQMMSPAYVLRAYNLTMLNKSDENKTPAEIQLKRQGDPKEKYVYMDTFDITYNQERPNEINVSIQFIERNKLVGYNE